MKELAWLLVLLPIANSYFVWHGVQVYRHDPGRSLLLAGILALKIIVWLLGIVIGLLAVRYIADLPLLPYDGTTIIVMFIIIQLLPGMFHLVIRQYERH